MTPPFVILHAASELFPYSKTGGLADVTAALPQALCGVALPLEVHVATPRYRTCPLPSDARRVDPRTCTEADPAAATASPWWRAQDASGVTTWWWEDPAWFDRDGIYVDAQGVPFADNEERFIAFSEAVLELAEARGVHLLHGHDWQTAWACYRSRLIAPRRPVVFTVHNLAFQGRMSFGRAHAAGVFRDGTDVADLEFHGEVNVMKGALRRADVVTTVSHSYAHEIRSPAFGEGLDGVLRHDVRWLAGITNGLDDGWNPASDAAIAAPFERQALAGRRRCQEALAAELGWPQDDTRTLTVGVVSRLTYQKGIDVALPALEIALHRRRIRLVVLGRGEVGIEQQLATLRAQHPDRCALFLTYDEALAHRIYAGVDLLLMPSRFEPCGLAQLIAMRYGAVPLVHRTGGLRDTVVDVDASEEGWGLATEQNNPGALYERLERALALFERPELWHLLRDRALRRDHSWGSAAAAYAEIYRTLLTDRNYGQQEAT